MNTRTLGRSGIDVSALGMGCWAIGGPFWRGDKPVGWGDVDDAESMRAIARALELGVTLFDTSDVYGCGHSERILGEALRGRRDQVVIATKFGNVFDEQTRQITDASGDPAHIRAACDASLRRLQTDYIDLYQFHLGGYDLDKTDDVIATLEELVDAGKIRWYGWSTDDPERAAKFAEGPHCAAIQQRLNLFEGNEETLGICEENNLASLNRGPLAMGLLTGKFSADSTLPANDVRAGNGWDFRSGEQARRLAALDEMRAVLTRDGRTLAQAAIGWLWAHSNATIPIPGFKNVAQVEENAGALAYGPLSNGQMVELATLKSS
ncbi:MAG: aldo/keto reductase [Caldilineaceae bacterium]|nr:aldo/keto reductase [Caldilineaceae bacterium]